MMSTAIGEKAFYLLATLVSRPTEFVDRLDGIAESGREALFARRPEYDAVEWRMVAAELDAQWPGFSAHLEETALRETESRVERRYSQVASSAWARRYNADLTLARCLYALCRATRPEIVVETGVAYGMSSAFLLEALEQNGRGSLLSVDLPPLGRGADELVGALVDQPARRRWVLRRGTSKRELPAMLSGRPIDTFFHDSLHTAGNMRREFAFAWHALRPGGILVSDDIEGNEAFLELHRRQPRYWRAIREAGKSSLIGLAVKSPGAAA